MTSSDPPRPPPPVPAPGERYDLLRRVRYNEVDRMGYLWHGHHVAMFEEARTEWLRARGLAYRALEDAGTLLVVVETGVRYLRPAAYEDQLVVRCGLAEASGVRLRFEYEVWRDNQRLATGFTVLAAADRKGRPQRLPEVLRALVEAALATPEAGTAGGPGAVQGGMPPD